MSTRKHFWNIYVRYNIQFIKKKIKIKKILKKKKKKEIKVLQKKV